MSTLVLLSVPGIKVQSQISQKNLIFWECSNSTAKWAIWPKIFVLNYKFAEFSEYNENSQWSPLFEQQFAKIRFRKTRFDLRVGHGADTTCISDDSWDDFEHRSGLWFLITALIAEKEQLFETGFWTAFFPGSSAVLRAWSSLHASWPRYGSESKPVNAKSTR